ncbi:MAG: aromatic amino acid ammonia-lyase [Pseudobdellovibrio sp.]
MNSNQNLKINGKLLVSDLSQFIFKRNHFSDVQIAEKVLEKTQKSHHALMNMIEKGIPIYGVTTGFGDSCTYYVDQELATQLQKNLIQYLSCGQGDLISIEASRAMFVIRLNSLSQGISAVSAELLQHMALLLKHDLVPAVPQEGSLGASGDLVPLAYLGQLIQGQGQCFYKDKLVEASDVFNVLNIKPYLLKPKEGLAIVNGTSTMAGVMLVNLKLTTEIIRLSEIATAWQCLVLNGKREAFGRFINEVAKTNPGQTLAAKNISRHLDNENYFPKRGQDVQVGHLVTDDFVQDRYSLRCAPQILGPIHENLQHSWISLEHEINSVTDNPVIDLEGQLEMGGNFYGGYLCQAMDFTKINLAHIADLLDRQVMMLIDNKSNRGLPNNLVDEENLGPNVRNIHHGLKGVHQAVSAITSEVIQKSIPSGIFSRSSESHNQDKVSLGMSAATSCSEMLKGVYKISAMQLVCLAQAIDLKKINLVGSESKELYDLVRKHVPFVNQDMSLGHQIFELTEELKKQAYLRG